MNLTQFPRFRSAGRVIAVFLLGAAALGASVTAQARNDVYWSVGVGGPGISIGVGNAAPYYAPQPVYVQPAPVYMPPPRPVYVAPPPVYYAPPVVYRPAPVYYGPPGHYKHRWRHRHGHRH